MNFLLIYDLNDIMPTGTLCFYKEKRESEDASMMPATPLKELTAFTDTSNISFSNLNMMMMMMNLKSLSMRVIGYCQQEENI